MSTYAEFKSPLGKILVTADGEYITGIYFEGQKYFPKDLSGFKKTSKSEVIRVCGRQLDEYFAGARTTFDLPLQPAGTLFQRQVWSALRKIASGKTATYGAIANKVGKPAASRAVGAAVGRNPISVVIPCHRVVGASGSLTGYAGGLERKKALLSLEGTI